MLDRWLWLGRYEENYFNDVYAEADLFPLFRSFSWLCAGNEKDSRLIGDIVFFIRLAHALFIRLSLRRRGLSYDAILILK